MIVGSDVSRLDPARTVILVQVLMMRRFWQANKHYSCSPR